MPRLILHVDVNNAFLSWMAVEVGRFIFSLDFGYIWTKNKESVIEILDKI